MRDPVKNEIKKESFSLISEFAPAGDQRAAISSLLDGLSQ